MPTPATEGAGAPGTAAEETRTAELAVAPGRWQRCRAGLRRARQLWRDFTGESAYDRYVERHALEHPGHRPLSPRQWWRAKAELDEQQVQARCC